MRKLICLNVLVLLTLSACRHARYDVIVPITKPLGKFKKIKINSFRVELPPPEDENNAPPPEHIKMLEGFTKGIHSRVQSRVALSGLHNGEMGRTLMVDGTLIGYQPADTHLRWSVGFGAGEGFAIVRIVLNEDVTGVTLGTANMVAAITSGYGDIDGRHEAAERIAAQVVRYLSHHQ